MNPTKTVIIELNFGEICSLMASMETVREILQDNTAAITIMEVLGWRDDFNSAITKLNSAKYQLA